MRTVIIESPYKPKTSIKKDIGQYEIELADNTHYARLCLKDSLGRGESPIAFHLLLTQVLDDNDQKQRELGLLASRAWHIQADCILFYTDKGYSEGMLRSLELCKNMKIKYEERKIF